MVDHNAIEVSGFVDRQKLNTFHLLTVILCFLILFADGLDFSAANVAAPAILRAFHAEKSAMGFVFGWGYFGIFVGSLFFGYIGDRFGRKVGAISGVLAYSLPALATVFASSLDQLALLRFLAGLGIGGVIPNTVALLNETAPTRFRASFVMVAFLGYSAGIASTGLIAARFLSEFGWPVVFLAAGIAGTVLGIVLAFVLPESVRFLTLAAPDSPRLRILLARIAPESPVDAHARFFLHEDTKRKFSIRLLFTGNRWMATSLLWVGYFAEALTFMTLSSWLPLLLESAGLRPVQASLAFSYSAFGAIAAILLLSRLLDKFGPMVALVSTVSCIVMLIFLGRPAASFGAIMTAAILAFSFSSGTHTSLNATVGAFYPTGIRGNGVGYATGMGRIAGIVGPVVTGLLLSAKLPLRPMLYLIAAPYVIVAIVFFGLGILYNRGLSGGVTDDAPRYESVLKMDPLHISTSKESSLD